MNDEKCSSAQYIWSSRYEVRGTRAAAAFGSHVLCTFSSSIGPDCHIVLLTRYPWDEKQEDEENTMMVSSSTALFSLVVEGGSVGDERTTKVAR